MLLSVAVLTLYYRGNGQGVVDYSQRAVMGAVTPLQRLTFSVAHPIQRAWGYVVTFGRDRADNDRLKLVNYRLKQEVRRLKGYEAENRRLKRLVGFKGDTSFDLVPARVISRSPSNWHAVVTIDVGRNEGIARRMAVVTPDGLVGQVIEAAARTSQVQLINDQKSGVGIEIRRTGQTGVVEGRIDRRLRLRFVGKEADVKVDDRVLTSGIGGVYPRGLVVGLVNQVENSQYELEKLIYVRPAVNFDKLAEVLVIRSGSHAP